MTAKDDLGDEVAERDVGRTGNRPSAQQRALVRDVRVKDVEQGRDGHPARRGDHRQRGAAPGMQRAARSSGLDHLFRREGEEEDHPDVVDGKLERVREPRVADRERIGPREGKGGAKREHKGMFEGKLKERAVLGPPSARSHGDNIKPRSTPRAPRKIACADLCALCGEILHAVSKPCAHLTWPTQPTCLTHPTCRTHQT